MNPSFVLVLKKGKVYRCKQNRQLSFLVKHDKIANLKVKASEVRSLLHSKRGTPVHKIKSQIILLMKKKMLNVNHFRFHLTKL